MNYNMTSQLDTLLEKPDITLEQILDEENIITELKNSGAGKFAKYVTNQPEIYSQMIRYITDYDPEHKDSKTQIKYPFLISELFFAENAQLIDFLFDAPQQEETESESPPVQDEGKLLKEQKRVQLIYQLLDFLKRDWICVTSAGYFSKTVIPIIKRRPIDFWERLQAFDISHLLKHLDTFHIAEVLEKLILIDSSNITGEDLLMNDRRKVLDRVIQMMFNKAHNADVVENIAYILNEIVNRAGQNPQNREWQQLVQVLNKPEQIFQLGTQTRIPALFQLLSNLLNYLQKRKQSKSEPQEEEVINYSYEGEESEEQFLNRFYPICSKFSGFLQATPLVGHQFLTTYGQIIEPLSSAKHSAIQLVIQLLQTNNPQISLFLAGDQTFETITRLVEKHQFNNQMLVLLEKIVNIVFNSDVHQELQLQVIGFLQFLITTNTNEQQVFGTLKNPIKPGYQGTLTRIANFLEQKASSNAQLKAALEQPEWVEYSKKELKTINDVEKHFLCDVNPKAKPHQNEDDWSDQDVERILDKFRTNKSKTEENKEQTANEPNEEVVEEEHKQEQGEPDEEDDQADNSEEHKDEEAVEEHVEENLEGEHEEEQQANPQQTQEEKHEENKEEKHEQKHEQKHEEKHEVKPEEQHEQKNEEKHEEKHEEKNEEKHEEGENQQHHDHHSPEKHQSPEKAPEGETKQEQVTHDEKEIEELQKKFNSVQHEDSQHQLEKVEEIIQEAIASPQVKAQEIGQILAQEELIATELHLNPDEIEKKSDSQVNAYWQNQEGHQPEPQ